MKKPSISVVVPTGGRTTVFAAVESALRQVGVDIDVVVVVNGDEAALIDVRARFASEPAVRVLWDCSGRGANASRQLGIIEAHNDLIALLDDDDTWHPFKLAHQLETLVDLRLQVEFWIIACGVNLIRAGSAIGKAPKVFGRSFVRADAYLFRRSSPRDRLHSLQTSTFLFPRSLAMRVPWPSDVQRHQDWDWLLRCQRHVGAVFLFSPHYDVDYSVSSVGSFTATTHVAESLAFADAHLTDPRVRGDFLLTRPFNMAVAQNDYRTALFLLRRALLCSRPGPWSGLRAALMCIRLLVHYAVVFTRRRNG